MTHVTNFDAPTPPFAKALAFAHAHSAMRAFRPFHWLNLAFDLRRRYPIVEAQSLMRIGVAAYDPPISEERFARNWDSAGRRIEPNPMDECIVTQMRQWCMEVDRWTTYHEERIRRQSPPPPPRIP